jgi:hypothetical protein
MALMGANSMEGGNKKPPTELKNLFSGEPSMPRKPKAAKKYLRWSDEAQTRHSGGAHFSRAKDVSMRRMRDRKVLGANIEYQAFWVSNQAPPATKAIRASRGTSRPNGTTFSTNTNADRAAIQKRFMTPATNNRAITSPQQPMQ